MFDLSSLESLVPLDDPERDFLLRCLQKRHNVCRLMTVEKRGDLVPVFLRICSICEESHIVQCYEKDLHPTHSHGYRCPTTGVEGLLVLTPDYFRAQENFR